MQNGMWALKARRGVYDWNKVSRGITVQENTVYLFKCHSKSERQKQLDVAHYLRYLDPGPQMGIWCMHEGAAWDTYIPTAVLGWVTASLSIPTYYQCTPWKAADNVLSGWVSETHIRHFWKLDLLSSWLVNRI